MKNNIGFNGRVFLTDAEWQTYMRRMPVRYIRKPHGEACTLCGLPASGDNPLEHSHRIPFKLGIVMFHLTPEYLDGEHNIVSAHKRTCNKGVEMSPDEISAYLTAAGLTPPKYTLSL